MIKDILVNLETGPGRDAAREYAISVAQLFEAHLTGIAFAYEPVNPGTIFDGVAAIIAEYREEMATAARKARDDFKRAAQQASLSPEADVIELGRGRGRRVRTDGAQPRSVHRRAGAPDSEAPEEAIIEGALFESGRPVLIVPIFRRPGIKLDRVMVCWDGSRNAPAPSPMPCRCCAAPVRSKWLPSTLSNAAMKWLAPTLPATSRGMA